MDKGERKLTEKELKRMENGGLKPPIFEDTAVSGRYRYVLFLSQ